jgi:hypothetical protein
MTSASPTAQLPTLLPDTCGTSGPGGVATDSLIVLDYTLRDLFDLDSDGAPPPTYVCHPLGGPNQIVPSLTKFTYHYKFPGNETSTSHISAKLSAKVSLQRYCFLAGNMPVTILDPSPASDARTIISRLRHDQQPNVSIISDLDQLQLVPGIRIAVAIPTDRLSHLPHAVDPETHYELSSKRCLAQSGLPTPPSKVIDATLQPEHSYDTVQLQREASRMLELLQIQRLPFMLKLNQSHSGMGTLAIHSEMDRAQAKAIMSGLLPTMLQQLNTANYNLHTCSLVLQDFIAGPAVGLSFFVTSQGGAVFIICCEQHFNNSGYWVGGSASYSKQNVLRRKYSQVMEEAAQFLHRKGYYGPAGIDIMTDTSGTHYIIDLNPRITAVFHLGPLTGHFVRQGLDTATVIKNTFVCSREVFEDMFVREIQDSRLIITGWAHDEPSSLSYAAIVVAESNSLEVMSLVTRVKAFVLNTGECN